MVRTSILICAGTAIAVTLLSPAACTTSANARPAIEASPSMKKDQAQEDAKAKERAQEKEREGVRSVRRHTTDIDRNRKLTKPDRSRQKSNNGVIVEIPEELDDPIEPQENEFTALEHNVDETKPVQFWVWGEVSHRHLSVDDEYWANENVFPIIRSLVNVPFAHGFNAPGYPVPQRRMGPDGEPLLVDTEAAAQQVFGYIDWYRTNLLARGRTEYKYAIWTQNWGKRNTTDPDADPSNVFTLGGNYRDKLQVDLPGNAEFESLYAANGILLNKMWSAGFVEHLDLLLDSNGIEAPTALFFDLEAAFTNRTAMRWWTAALEDPRANTELVDGQYTMAQIDAQAPDYDPDQEIWRPVNRQMYAYTNSVCHRVLEYALWEGFWKQAKEVWPDVLVSNYGLHGGTSDSPVPIARLNAKTSSAPLRFADYASPTLYGFPTYAINAADTLSDHLARFDVEETGNEAIDRNALVVKFHKARLKALTDAGTEVAPWICPPEFVNLSQEETIEIMNYGTDLGVRNWLLWSQDQYDWTPIIEAVSEYAEQQDIAQDSFVD